MKKILIFICGCLLFSPLFLFAQDKAVDFTSLLLVKMEAKEDYKPQEPNVLKCCNYILSTPVDQVDDNCGIAMSFMFKWMTGTPEYMFQIDNDAKEIMEEPELMFIFFASLCKYAIENPGEGANASNVKLNGFKIFLDYCANKDNHVKQTKYLKKMINANKKGKLEKELKL